MRTVACIGSEYWGQNLVRNFYELGALAECGVHLPTRKTKTICPTCKKSFRKIATGLERVR